jgi:hypothetical protein
MMGRPTLTTVVKVVRTIQKEGMMLKKPVEELEGLTTPQVKFLTITNHRNQIIAGEDPNPTDSIPIQGAFIHQVRRVRHLRIPLQWQATRTTRGAF